jgi:GNAT superfamily N-acetyltransferase
LTPPQPPAITTGPSFEIREARRGDVAVIHSMIGALADYEKLRHLFVASEADIEAALFGPAPRAEVLLAWQDGKAAAFALYLHNFSTFLGRPGLWLEDLFVRPEYRRQGCAQALLRALAGIAQARGCGRFEWSVLDWNTSAIEFYQSLGATVLPDWRIVRVVGPSLAALARRSVGTPGADAAAPPIPADR